MNLRNINRKNWFEEAMSLDDLIIQLFEIGGNINTERCKVVGVFQPMDSFASINPIEAQVIAIQTRNNMLKYQLGKHFNAIVSQLLDPGPELDESSDDAQHEIDRDGDVVYIVLGRGLNTGASEKYEYLED